MTYLDGEEDGEPDQNPSLNESVEQYLKRSFLPLLLFPICSRNTKKLQDHGRKGDGGWAVVAGQCRKTVLTSF